MIPFPSIPTVVNSQALSAATLNSYTRACRWLLGVSHEPYLADGVFGHLAWEGWVDVYRGWALHYANTLHYDIHGQFLHHGDGEWWVSIQYRGTDGAWRSVVELHRAWSPAPASHRFTGTVSLAGLTHATPGRLHQWRVQARGLLGHPVVINARRLAIRNTASLAAWPTFTNGAASDAAHLNGLRANLNALRGFLPPAEALAYMSGETVGVAGAWTQVDRERYIRYRPQRLVVGLLVLALSNNWQWRVNLTNEAGATVTIYTSPARPVSGVWAAYEEEIDISAHTGYAVEGAYLRVTIQVFCVDTWGFRARRPYVFRKSAQVPAAGWPTLPIWAHGDANVGATRLATLGNAGARLHTGSEALWSEVGFANRDFLGLWGAPTHMGLRKRRWLAYLPRAGETPVLRYGTTFARDDTVSLPNDGEVWHNYDIGVARLAPGQPYLVEGCHSVFESEGVLESI